MLKGLQITLIFYRVSRQKVQDGVTWELSIMDVKITLTV